MLKHIDRLFQSPKTWDYAILYARGKNPVLLERSVSIQLIDEDSVVSMNFHSTHPNPQSEADAQRKFTVSSYVSVSEIYAVDYFTESKIITAPGIPPGMKIIQD